MAFIPVPEAVEVALIYTNDLQAARSVFHFKRAGGGPYDIDALTALAGVIENQWDLHLKSHFTASVGLLGCNLRALDSESAPATEHFLEVPLQGTEAGNVVQDNVAFALKKVTGLSGRSFRGRVYHFGFSVLGLDGPGDLTLATANNIKDAYNDFRLGIEGEVTNSVMQVVSKYSGVANIIRAGRYGRQPIPRVEGISTPVLSFAYSDLHLDSQRRRLPGRGI